VDGKINIGFDPGAGLARVKDRMLPAAVTLHYERGHGIPDLTLQIEVRDGVPQCRQATLQSTEDGREVLASDLRGVKLEEFIEAAAVRVGMDLTEQRQPDGVVTVIEPITTEKELRGTLAQIRAVRHEAKRRVTPELLQQVADVYRDNVDNNPTDAVAQFTGRAHRTATLYIHQARAAGYLGAAIVGKAGEQS
jgi:hypothetical protein